MKIVLLIIIIAGSTKLFEGTPLDIAHEIVFNFLVLLGFLFCIKYSLRYFFLIKRASLTQLALLTTPFIIVCLSALRSYMVYGQPLHIGILSERGWFIFGLIFWLRESIISGRIKEYHLKLVFQLLFYFTVISFLLASNLIKSDSASNFDWAYVSTVRGVRFTFDKIFLSFGIFYSFISLIKKKRLRDLFMVLICSYIVLFIIKGRTYSLMLFSVMAFFYYSHLCDKANFSKNLKVFLNLTFGTLFLITLASMYISLGETLVEKQLDSSIIARLNTLDIILLAISEKTSFMFGTGRLSYFYQGGYPGVYGHFYPADMGILGGIFLYGIIFSILIVVALMLFYFKVLKSFDDFDSMFINALKMIVFSAIITILQHGLYLGPNDFFLCAIILNSLVIYRKSPKSQF